MGDLMRSNDMPRTATDGIDALLMRVEAIKRELRDATNGLLKAAGISVTPTGMTINSALNVTGDLNATGNTTVGGTMNVTGDAVFSGDLAVPNGSITNAALTSPTLPDARKAGSGTSSVMVTTTKGPFAIITYPVPAGFTKAQVIATSTLQASNSTAIETVINGDAGELVFTDGTSGNATNAHTAVLTGLTGGSSFTVRTDAYSAAGTTVCYIVTCALVVFSR